MKTSIYLKTVLFSALASISLVSLDSCKKDDTESTIDNVIKTAPAETVKTELAAAATFDALPAEVKTAATSITNIISDAKAQTIADIDVNKIIQDYQTALTLTSDEVTKLKNNDEYTYNAVVNRMSKLPSFFSDTELAGVYAQMQSVPTLNSRLLTDPGTVDDLYAVNLYQGVLDLQSYINTYTIPALQKLAELKTASLKSASTALDSNSFTLVYKRYYVTYFYMTFNNFYIVRITYIRYLTKKHSGGTIG